MGNPQKAKVLVLFYSRYGATVELARHVARGVESVAGARAVLRTVPPVAPVTEKAEPPVPDEGAPYATLDDLVHCDGLILGSPIRFGNMAAPLKAFLDSTSALWISGGLAGKPGAVFTSGETPHGGQEATLLSMMLPLLHHGMYLVGVPFTEKSISSADGGGTPYGASHVSHPSRRGRLSEAERATAQALGRRVASLALAIVAARRTD